MTRPPVILISATTQRAGSEFGDRSLSLSNRYALAVTQSGGLPWVLPNLPSASVAAAAVARCDGVLLTGGDDLQPGLYADSLPDTLRRTLSEPEPERDVLELHLVDEVFRQRKPFLGICRGLQILNVALGGTLIVDLPSERPGAIEHKCMDRKNEVVHEVALAPDSRLAQITGAQKLGVNSTHHQAAGRVADLLKVTASSADGVVEGLELRHGVVDMPFVLAVQFHPERLCARYREHRALFEHFVSACAADGPKEV